jgi:hypothetical protein
MQYTASGYVASLLSAFEPLSGSRPLGGVDAGHLIAADPFIERIGAPLWGALHGRVDAMRRRQTSRIRWYLLYLISALIGLLLYLWLAATR